MSIAQQTAHNLPFLRRYARALTGEQSQGDSFVRATLESIIADPSLLGVTSNLRCDLYRVFYKIWESAHVEIPHENAYRSMIEHNVQERLSAITPVSRQALLLTTLEGFDDAEAAEIMGVGAREVRELVGQAIKDIESDTLTDVLIIEDEPLISMQLESLVTDMGHSISGTATTHAEAVAAVSAHRPGLVLADIQLADGSSGLDAVKEILGAIDVPVIFITAFPERLLTGERPEPTYLITKPFLDATVKAAISQALFLGSTALPQLT